MGIALSAWHEVVLGAGGVGKRYASIHHNGAVEVGGLRVIMDGNIKFEVEWELNRLSRLAVSIISPPEG